MTDQSKPTVKGGTEDFNWNDVRYMSYKDRESYLGYTVKIGFLDKGGKWRKRDWWKGNSKKRNKDLSTITQDPEFLKEKERDEKRMRIALGLEEKEEEFKLPQMTGEDARYLTQKIKAEAEQEWEDEQVEKMPGLGMKGNYSLGKEKSKPTFMDEGKALRLEGVGLDELQQAKKIKEEQESALEEESRRKKPKLERKEGKRKKDDEDGLGITKEIKKQRKKEKKRRKKEKRRKHGKERRKKRSKQDKLKSLYRI